MCLIRHLICHLFDTSVVYIGMTQSSDQVVEGEQQYVTLCAVLYQGKLGRNLNVMLQVRNSSLGDSGLFLFFQIYSSFCHFIWPAIAGQDYILQSQTLDFKYDERSNTSSMPCFNVTILDDNNPENELYITIGLAVALNDQSDVFIVPGRNQTTVDILDDDHGMFSDWSYACKPYWSYSELNYARMSFS